MTDGVVIGIGNSFRRDDGVGIVVAEEVSARGLRDVRVMTGIAEPTTILEAWTGAALAIVVDAASGCGATPGRIRRWTSGDSAPPAVVSSHAFRLKETYALGEALGRIPDKLVVFGIDVADTDYGVGLTSEVAASVPTAIEAILSELGVNDPAGHSGAPSCGRQPR